MSKGLTEEQLREKLRGMIGYRDGKRVYAQELAAAFGISKAYLSEVLNGTRRISQRLAEALGYERVVTFQPKETPDE